MLKQKEFDLIVTDLRKDNMNSYEEWFNENANCEVKDETINGWRKGIRLHSSSKKHAIIVIEGFDGVVFRVNLDNFRMTEDK